MQKELILRTDYDVIDIIERSLCIDIRILTNTYDVAEVSNRNTERRKYRFIISERRDCSIVCSI